MGTTILNATNTMTQHKQVHNRLLCDCCKVFVNWSKIILLKHIFFLQLSIIGHLSSQEVDTDKISLMLSNSKSIH